MVFRKYFYNMRGIGHCHTIVSLDLHHFLPIKIHLYISVCRDLDRHTQTVKCRLKYLLRKCKRKSVPMSGGLPFMLTI